MSNKIVKEDDAIGIINYKDNVNNDTKLELNSIINSSYIVDDCDYVLQINANNFKGDFMCLGDLFDLILDNLKAKNMLQYVNEFYVKKTYYDDGEKKYIGMDFLEEN